MIRTDTARLPFAASPKTVACLAFLWLASSLGCRAPWTTTPQAHDGVPSFDRLIEIEQQKRAGTQSSRNPLASRLRPGQRLDASPPSRHSAIEQEVASQSPTDESEAELEQMLAQVPPAQRELLRRQADALAQRSPPSTENARAAKAPATAKPDEPTREETVSYSLSDEETERSSYGASAKYAMNAAPADRGMPSSGSSGKTTPVSTSDSPRSQEALASQFSLPTGAVRESEPKTSQPGPARQASDVETAVTSQSAAEKEQVVTASASSAAAPSISDKALDWQAHLRQAISQLEGQSTSASPEEQVRREMTLRLLYLANLELAPALEPIEGLKTEGQDFVRESFQSLYEVTNPSGNPVESKRYSLAMLSQRKAMRHLASASDLEVNNVAFCTNVDGFGMVQKFSKNRFDPDQEVLLYCELDNFHSVEIEGKGFETQLQGSYEIVDSNGRRIADQLLPMDSNLCRNRRRDYFIAYRMYMPQKIDAGKYELRLIVEDLKGRKFGQASVPFEIAHP